MSVTKHFVEKSTWILEHSDDYILGGWRLLTSVSVLDFVVIALLIVGRVLVGATDFAATKYDCAFVLRDKYLVPYPNPLGPNGTCTDSPVFLERGNTTIVVCIVVSIISLFLDSWTPIRKEEHGFCECTQLNFMCGLTWLVHLAGIFSLLLCATAYGENYDAWDSAACLSNPYFTAGLNGENPYGDGCAIAYYVMILTWASVATYLLSVLLLLFEVCR